MLPICHMGDEEKRVRFQDEIEHIDRRRSSRIIALEEKKQQEKERKVVLALPKQKSSNNHIDDRNKGKEKIDGGNQMDDLSEDMKHGTSKKGHKRKSYDQLISSIQEGRHSNNTTTSSTNVSSLINMPERHILELIIDFLQRKDEAELFHEPINLDMVKNYNQLAVKEPMDFGTIRAKIHENLYTNLEEFKRDVYLLCCNAMNAFPETSRYYKVAEIIGLHAMRLFKDLGVNSEHLNLDSSLNKKLLGKRPQDKQLGTSFLERFSPKLFGGNDVNPFTYGPLSKKSMVSEFLDVNKSNIQELGLNKDDNNYTDSLLSFVEDLGPTPQRVARKKLEALKFGKPSDGYNQTLKLVENAFTTPQKKTQVNTLSSAQILSLALPYFSKPLAIPGTSTQQNKDFNNMFRSVNIIDDTNYKGKRIITKDNWHDSAAILLSSNFLNNNKGKNKIGFESSNAEGNMEICDFSKSSLGKSVSPLENNSVSTHVHPTCVVLAPQPLESIIGKLPYEQFPLYQPSPVVFNEINPYFLSQSRPEESMTCVPSKYLSELSLVHHQPCSSMFGLNDPSSVSLFSQLREDECIPKQNLYEVTMLPSQETNSTSLFGLGTPYHPEDYQALMDSTDFNTNPYIQHVSSQMNLLNPVPLQEPRSSSSLEILLGGGLVAPMDLPEDPNLQLLWGNDQQPNLSLQL